MKDITISCLLSYFKEDNYWFTVDIYLNNYFDYNTQNKNIKFIIFLMKAQLHSTLKLFEFLKGFCCSICIWISISCISLLAARRVFWENFIFLSCVPFEKLRIENCFFLSKVQYWWLTKKIRTKVSTNIISSAVWHLHNKNY